MGSVRADSGAAARINRGTSIDSTSMRRQYRPSLAPNFGRHPRTTSACASFTGT